MTVTNVTADFGGAADARGISWKWLLALGVVLSVLGAIGLGMTYALTRIAVFWFGILAIAGGAGQLVDAFHHKGWRAFIWHVLIGVLYVAVGFTLVTMPLASALWLTFLTAIALVAIGITRIIMALTTRALGPVWVGVLLSGVVSIALGFIIYGTVTPPSPEALATPEGQLAWFQSWGWIIGLFVAIEMLMEGLSLVFIALAVRTHDEAHPSATAVR